MMIRSNKRGAFLLFSLLLVTLASAKRGSCISPSVVDYDSCIALSSKTHECLWCKAVVDDITIQDIESTFSFCTSIHSLNEDSMNRMECESKKNRKHKRNTIINSSITIDNNRSIVEVSDASNGGLSNRNISNKDTAVNKYETIKILKPQGNNDLDGFVNQEYRNLQNVNDSFCSNLTVNSYNGHLYGSQTGLSMNWSDAQTYAVASLPLCCGAQAHLVTVTDSTEYDFVQQVVQGQNERFWIGLNDGTDEGQFKWVDDTPESFTAWNINEPNNGKGTDEDCVEMLFTGSTWMWNDLKCDSLKTGYVFEYDCTFCSSLVTYQKNHHLYDKKYTALNWTQAQSDAQSLPMCCGTTAHLVTIEDADENKFIEGFGKKYDTQNAWIGLNDIETEGDYLWVDKTPFNYSSWDVGEPNDFYADCVRIGDTANGFFWNDIQCKHIQPSYLLEYDCDFCSTLKLNQKNLHVYGIHTGEKTWNDAQAFVQSLPMCCDKTAHLVTIQDSSENAFVEKIAQVTYDNAWLGLNDIEAEGMFKWVDGTPFSFNNWNASEPNNGGGNKDCVNIQYDGFKWFWNNLDCNDAQKSYIFEYDCDFCATLHLNQENTHLYGIQSGQLTWNDAQADVQSLPVCCGKTAHLVTIQDATENAVTKSIIKGTSQYFWAGLNDIANEGHFKWVDGTPFSFNAWHKGEPNNVGGNEDCVLIQFNGTQWGWNDDNCNITKHSYIFEYDCGQKPVPSTLPTKTPVRPTKTPILPTRTPIQPTRTPIQPTKRPTQPTKIPVLPTKTPIQPTKTPVIPTDTPILPTKTPIQPTKRPTRPTKIPIHPTETPVQPTKTPTQPTKKPVRPTRKPVRPTKRPVRKKIMLGKMI